MKLAEHIDTGGWRLGRLLVTPRKLCAGDPFVDGATTTLTRDNRYMVQPVSERYGGLVLNFLPWPGRRNHSVVVSWLQARVPNPARWRPAFIAHGLVWWAKGKPQQSTTPERYCTFHGFVHPFDGISDGAVCHRPLINAEEMRG